MKLSFPLPSLPNAILSFCLYVSLVRGTNIGLFYPSDEFQLGYIDYTPQTIMNLILLVGLVAYFFVIKDYSFIMKSLSGAFMGCLAAGIALSFALSVDVVQSGKYVLAMVVIALPAILYFKVHGSEKLLSAFIKFIIVMAFLNMAYVLALPQYGIMSERHAGRWRGLFEHKNMAGPFFALSFFFVLYSITLKKSLETLVKILALCICLLFAVLAQSSTGLVVFFLMASTYPCFMLLLRIRSVEERVGIALIFISLILLAITFFGGAIEQLFFDVTGRDATLTGRTGIWAVIIDLVANRPFVGFGPGMSERPEFMARIQGAVGWEVKGTHNSYLDLLINFGYPTTILMVLYLLKTWGKFFTLSTYAQFDKKMTALVSSTVFTVLIMSLSSAATLYSRDVFWVFVVGCLLILTGIYKQVKLNRYTVSG